MNDPEIDTKSKSFPRANGVSGDLSGSCLCHRPPSASLGRSEGPRGSCRLSHAMMSVALR